MGPTEAPDTFKIFSNLCEENNMKLSKMAESYLKLRIKNEKYLRCEDGIRTLFSKTLNAQEKRVNGTIHGNSEIKMIISIQDLQ